MKNLFPKNKKALQIGKARKAVFNMMNFNVYVFPEYAEKEIFQSLMQGAYKEKSKAYDALDSDDISYEEAEELASLAEEFESIAYDAKKRVDWYENVNQLASLYLYGDRDLTLGEVEEMASLNLDPLHYEVRDNIEEAVRTWLSINGEPWTDEAGIIYPDSPHLYGYSIGNIAFPIDYSGIAGDYWNRDGWGYYICNGCKKVTELERRYQKGEYEEDF